MKIRILFIWLILCASVSAEYLGIFKSDQYVSTYLKEPLNPSGVVVKPESAQVMVSLDNDTITNYFAASSTWPFTALGIQAKYLDGDTNYVFRRLISDIDGAGCASCGMSIRVVLYAGTEARQTDGKLQIVGQTLNATFAFIDAAISSRLEPEVGGRKLGVGTSGHAELDLNSTIGSLGSSQFADGFLTALKIANDAITGAKIADGSITPTEAPNLDAAITSRLAPGGTLAQVTTVVNTQQLGGTTAGLNALNEGADNDDVFTNLEWHLDGNVNGVLTGVFLLPNGLDGDTSFTGLQTRVEALHTKADSLVYLQTLLNYVYGACDGCMKVYYPNDGTGYKDRFEVKTAAGVTKVTTYFKHSNSAPVLDTSIVQKNY